MTRFERRMNEAERNTVFASAIVKEYSEEIDALKSKFRQTKNSFRRLCIMQEIESLSKEKDMIDIACIG